MAVTEPTDVTPQPTVTSPSSRDGQARVDEPVGVHPHTREVAEHDRASLAEPDIAGLDIAEPDRRLLISDLRVAFLLANHARYRAITRLFGVSPDQVNLMTLIVILLVADKAYDGMTRVVRVPGAPSLGDGLLAGGALRESARAIAGPAARDTPLLGVLVMAALLGNTVRPAVAKSIHEIRTSSHRMALGFHHRYGYIVDPGHWRERRARRQEVRA
jgi:hypothetical protein